MVWYFTHSHCIIISLFPLLVLLFSDRKTSSFFLKVLLSSGKADRKSHASSSHKKNHVRRRVWLEKEEEKIQEGWFHAFETEDAPNDGGDDAGVAAAVAEKIEDLDRTCFSLVLGFSLSSFFFIRFFLCCSRNSSFHSAKRDGDDDENATTVCRRAKPLLDLNTAAGDV